ncbi:AAA domain-containing protein [Lysobacter enzymogenes]|uniref:AAA domain-containing protein n=1 Tax=Lysobacter enzymogenes TaxID=69 RepID=UPI00099E0045|nr:AAA domain-containing protein [Lysobacter enzymogenes]UZW59032.1 AAA domain-containing protein [Lysobacter enzymogenes]
MDALKSHLRPIASRVSQYFRDFLDSDFKRQQAPRRRIVLTSDSGFRSGLRTSPYPNLDRDLWALLSRPSGDDLALNIAPRKYVRPISPVLRKVIEEQVNAIPASAIEVVGHEVGALAVSTYASAVQDPELWVEAVQQHLADKASEHIIRPLIAHLDGPLRTQAYWVVDSLHAAERDLVERVCSDLSRILPEQLARLLATQEPAPLLEAIPQFLTLEGTRQALIAFFEGFVAADAYLEFRDLETYVATSDNLQLYLYLGAIKFKGNQYPLFFLPIEVQRDPSGAGYKLKLVNHLYANRKAIDFVLQELAAGLNRAWVSPIPERITYLKPEQSVYEEARLLFRRVANAMDLGGEIELSSSAQDAATAQVGLSSALYLAAFERADEALINDYEEILDALNKGGSSVVDLFEGIVGGVLRENPKSIAAEVEAQWDALPMVERVVYDSPIPLNEEQRKVLLAVRHPEGKIVVVAGPPGTGKSHTITAIAADCAFNHRSCLVLSDKTEALDVVYDKLSEAMSRVRHDPDFPNPLLRLGQQAANFKKLTSNQTVSQIGAYAKAMKANQARLEAERQAKAADLKQQIAQTVTALGAIELAAVQAMHEDEAQLTQLHPALLEQLRRCKDARLQAELDALAPGLPGLEAYLVKVFDERDHSAATLWDRLNLELALADFAKDAGSTPWACFEQLDADQLRVLGSVLVTYQQLRMPVFGYLFRGGAVRELERQINLLPVSQPLLLKPSVARLQAVAAAGNALRLKLAAQGQEQAFPAAYRWLATARPVDPAAAGAAQAFALLRRIDPTILDTLLERPKDDARLWPLAIRFLAGWLRTREAFAAAPQIDYVGTKTQLERLNTSVMNSHVDGRLISFMDNYRSDARALAGVISSRQKFPEEKFGQVRESFPVIIASIREFGEFMPLAPDLFDVVVIDEASQVSVAQALPALLRARKVVVLGDDKQFSNVKSSNASIEQNEKYRGELTHYFRANVSDAADALQRLSMFDVKRSILEFCNHAASYSVMLRKHFRSYQELIGYSSGTFYGHQLQAIKIRGVPVDEVIRFDRVDTADKKTTRGTNEAEADFILERLLELIEEEDPPTVGVITPFREQQTYLSKRLFSHARGAEFERLLKLKVMTFDSCQGEERNIIFYSMVATAEHDALNYVFPVELTDAQQAVEEKLKVQRLNVGFSRAQEMVWFVHSKPLGEYRGAIGQALHHYANVLDRAARLPDAQDVDPSSPMEARVLEWLHQTPFYQQHLDDIDVFAQFEVGAYLKQLDPTYQHPAWRVDFLVTYQSPKGPIQIVIEYDGFEHHFQKGKHIHIGNHERYLHEADVERQLTLESYGYRFLRINRFNLGDDPVATLSERLERLVEIALGEHRSEAVSQVQSQAAGLASKELKPCSRCGKIKEQAEFFDPALKDGAGGFGRVCLACKSESASGSSREAGAKRRRRWR